MSYRSETIAVAIERMNRQYFLPAIQREFVWKPEQIVQLFDSIMRGYPISSFLFWELKPENRDKWQVYKFRLSAIHVESCVWGWLKRSRMRSRKWRKLVIPKACHKIVRKPRLKPSVGPLLERFVK